MIQVNKYDPGVDYNYVPVAVAATRDPERRKVVLAKTVLDDHWTEAARRQITFSFLQPHSRFFYREYLLRNLSLPMGWRPVVMRWYSNLVGQNPAGHPAYFSAAVIWTPTIIGDNRDHDRVIVRHCGLESVGPDTECDHIDSVANAIRQAVLWYTEEHCATLVGSKPTDLINRMRSQAEAAYQWAFEI